MSPAASWFDQMRDPNKSPRRRKSPHLTVIQGSLVVTEAADSVCFTGTGDARTALIFESYGRGVENDTGLFLGSIMPEDNDNLSAPAFAITFFPDQSAQRKKERTLTLNELREEILNTTAPTKARLPWLKLARFGDVRTEKNCLRHNANVVEISGVETDYDAKQISFEQAVEIARKAKLCVLIYTSASYTQQEPKWRLLAPTSQALPSGERAKLVARINGVYSGVFSPESFVLSQSFYYGSVKSNPAHKAVIVEGDYIDLRDDLDATAIGHRGTDRPDRTWQNTEPADLEEIRFALSVIPSDTYALWFRCVGAIWRELGDEGFPLFLEWSQKCPDKFDERALHKKWEEAPRITQITAGSIFRWADEADPDWRKRFAAERRVKQIELNREIGDDTGEENFVPILTLDDMIQRLVLIGDVSGVADRVSGRAHKKEPAFIYYASSKHGRGPALRRWIESDRRFTVDVLAWIPGQPQICDDLEMAEKSAFNTWRGLPPMSHPKDWRKRVKPFLKHVEFLIPIKSERDRFLQWLAHIVQRPEVLPHTSYLFITPTMGTGRNLLGSMLVRALRGFVAADMSLPELLDGGFSGRLSKKLLVIVDEAREGSGERRYQRAEALKRFITKEHRDINTKYGLQSVEKNCIRLLMFSNHDDAVPFDIKDRRVIVIANPIDPKDAAYYTELYGLLDDPDFIGSIRHWMETHDLSGFNPGEHAPLNEAKERSLDAMLSDVERALVEFKYDCLYKPDDWDKRHKGTPWQPRELVTRDDVRDRAGEKADDRHLTKAIERAGMLSISPKKRRLDYKDKKHTIVIVDREKWTYERVLTASQDELVIAMGWESPKSA